MSQLHRPRKILAKGALASKGRILKKAPSAIRGSFRQLIESTPNPRVLVIRSLGGIGDVLMTTPAVRRLKELYPQAHVTYACDRHSTGNDDVYYQLLLGCPFIDAIVDSRTVSKENYTASIDITSCCIQYEHRQLPTKNRIDIFADAMKIDLRNYIPWYRVTDSERLAAVTFKKSLPNKKIVFLHTASFDPKRTWPIQHYINLIKMAEQLPVHFLISDFNNCYQGWDGIPNGTLIPNQFVKIRAKASLIEQCDFLIGPDSGLMHLSGALGIPSLIIFGSIPASARINHYPTHQGVSLQLPCQPCWYKGCPYQVKCLTSLQPELVFEKMKLQMNL